MPRVCLTCSHPARAEVDEALIRGEARASIARRFNVPPDSLDRHWTGDHIAREVRERFDSDYDALARLSDEMVACATRLVMRKRATAADVSAAARVAEVRARLEGRWGDVGPIRPRVKSAPFPFDLAHLLAELRDRGALPAVHADAAALPREYPRRRHRSHPAPREAYLRTGRGRNSGRRARASPVGWARPRRSGNRVAAAVAAHRADSAREGLGRPSLASGGSERDALI